MFPLRNCFRLSKARCANMCRWSRPSNKCARKVTKGLPAPEQIRRNGRPPRKRRWRKSCRWTRCGGFGSVRWKSPNWCGGSCNRSFHRLAGQFAIRGDLEHIERFQPVRRSSAAARVLVQRQRGTDNLRCHRAGCDRDHRGQDNQIAPGRDVQFPILAAGRRNIRCRRRRIRRTGRKRGRRI